MYWMVGCPPGGSAGTSFCSGTEMSISRRAMRSPRFCSPGYGSHVLPLDLVLEHADFLDLELDLLAVLEIPAELEPAAVADRAGADELARHQRLVPGHMRDDLLEREQHALGGALRAHLA